ncbi:hypothetical protein LC613_41025 [Nostoc sphaeroides CHAB 2801]|uniref:hypothetical protein n=1 Tax=Nostoc sphaeroides TaxID=446679 RepID=UPI001E2BA702|nr:hypothetical protein [Nostoc sphaeroides]MCC5633804.1 hypothetical protein [Nostoc sphaeroides CHAB 2801]
MEKIQQFLQPYNIEATDDEVANLCAQVDADINQLTDQQAQAIATQIIELRLVSGKLATNGKPKNGNGKLGKNSPRRKSTPLLQGAISLMHPRFQIKKFNP